MEMHFLKNIVLSIFYNVKYTDAGCVTDGFVPFLLTQCEKHNFSLFNIRIYYVF